MENNQERQLPPLVQKLADAIDAADCKIIFGLQLEHIELIEATLKKGFTIEYVFEKVAKQINWDKYTLACWYIKHLTNGKQRKAAIRGDAETGHIRNLHSMGSYRPHAESIRYAEMDSL